jgi:DNA topoisomerase-3
MRLFIRLFLRYDVRTFMWFLLNLCKKNEDISKTLKREARNSQWLVLWLDCDREGENIAFEVIKCCRETNPNLSIFRAHFSALIPAAIHGACRNLTDPNVHDSDAVDARSELDLRLGKTYIYSVSAK